MWKPAVESSAVDGDLAVSEYERDCTLLSLEARVADGADDQRSPEQLTVRAEAHCADGLVAQRKAAGWHVDLMLVARRRWGYGERQRASGIAVGRADGCGAEQSDTPTATRSRYPARICPSPDCCSPHMIRLADGPLAARPPRATGSGHVDHNDQPARCCGSQLPARGLSVCARWRVDAEPRRRGVEGVHAAASSAAYSARRRSPAVRDSPGGRLQ